MWRLDRVSLFWEGVPHSVTKRRSGVLSRRKHLYRVNSCALQSTDHGKTDEGVSTHCFSNSQRRKMVIGERTFSAQMAGEVEAGRSSGRTVVGKGR